MAILKSRVGEVLTERVVGVPPRTPIGEAVRLMRGKNISSIVVIEDGRPVGIFTERNVVRLAASRGVAFAAAPISDVMSAPVLTVPRESYIYDVFNLLGNSKIRHLVAVNEDGSVAGMISQTNLVDHLGEDCFVRGETVADIMSRIVFSVPPTTSVLRALTEMADKSISCLVVAENGRPLGLLSERDVAAFVCEGVDVSRRNVGEVMTAPALCVSLREPARRAISLMRARRVRRLVVTDEEGVIQGLTTQTNIVKNLESRYIETLREVIREKDEALRSTSSDLEEKTIYLDALLHSLEHVGVVATDVDCRIRYFNPAAERLLGVRAGEMIGCDVHDTIEDYFTEHTRFENSVRLTRDHGSLGFSAFLGEGAERRYMRGRVGAIRDQGNEVRGYLLTLSDITERKLAEDTIRRMAFYDALTDLPNRLLFRDRLELELARTARSGSCMGLLCMDLNGFKEINDTLGHQAGDKVLQILARRVEDVVRRNDTAARVGGDEFLFILPDVGGEVHARALAARLTSAVEKPLNIGGAEVGVTASLGLALFPEHAGDADALLRAADRAMYVAKSRADDRSCCVLAECDETADPGGEVTDARSRPRALH
jgi:diguanylate cyclase (GGDEF)-like protein/PAS domain S-box-containing protein